jgi:hypothetical protein
MWYNISEESKLNKFVSLLLSFLFFGLNTRREGDSLLNSLTSQIWGGGFSPSPLVSPAGETMSFSPNSPSSLRQISFYRKISIADWKCLLQWSKSSPFILFPFILYFSKQFSVANDNRQCCPIGEMIWANRCCRPASKNGRKTEIIFPNRECSIAFSVFLFACF